MGRQATKRELFVSVSLDEYVPEDHLLRAVDRYLDLSEFRGNLAVSNSHTGRPSIDPELIARMLIIGYCYGIRSERRLCEEVSMNLAYRWFCRRGLKDKVPDHSSFRRTGTVVFETMRPFANCSIRFFVAACLKAWCEEKVVLPTPALSRPMRNDSAVNLVTSRSTGVILSRQAAQCAST